MLPRADIAGTRPVAYVEALAPTTGATDTRQEVYHRLNQIALGQQVAGKVLENLKDGTFLVRLANTSARMSLPVGTQVGDSLSMKLIDRQPRPTFLLEQGGAAKSGDAPATLSNAGRLIDRLLQSAQQGGTSTAVLGRVPVLPSPQGESAQVAVALQNAVDISGLFYESHLAQWAEGKRSRAALMREPQALQNASLAQETDAGQTESALLRHLVQQWTDSGRPMAGLAQELQARAGNNQSLMGLMSQMSAQPGADNVQQVNPQAAQMINAQLNTLENQRFVWQGELWPGQAMEWEVSKDDGTASQDGGQQESWHSVVRFELPTLGTVSATIHLVGDHVSISMNAETEDSASRLRAHGTELIDALGSTGTTLSALIVNQHG